MSILDDFDIDKKIFDPLNTTNVFKEQYAGSNAPGNAAVSTAYRNAPQLTAEQKQRLYTGQDTDLLNNRGKDSTANGLTAAQTRDRTRRVEALNNRLYYNPGQFNTAMGGGGGYTAGGVYQMPVIENMDTRAQERNEGYEARVQNANINRQDAERSLEYKWLAEAIDQGFNQAMETFRQNLKINVADEKFNRLKAVAKESPALMQWLAQFYEPGTVAPGPITMLEQQLYGVWLSEAEQLYPKDKGAQASYLESRINEFMGRQTVQGPASQIQGARKQFDSIWNNYKP